MRPLLWPVASASASTAPVVNWRRGMLNAKQSRLMGCKAWGVGGREVRESRRKTTGREGNGRWGRRIGYTLGLYFHLWHCLPNL